MTIYDLENATNSTDLLGFVDAVNTVADDWPARLLLIGIFAIIFVTVVLRSQNALKAMVSSGFVTTLAAMLVYGMGLVTFIEPLISLGVLIVSTIVLYLGGTE